MQADALIKTLDRKADILEAMPALHVPLRSVAESLTRRNLAGARAELLNEALQRCTAVLYDMDASSQLCNVDEATGRILLPVPWGRAGHRKWGLRYTESLVLRLILMAHQGTHERGKRPALFLYDADARTWSVNLIDFPTVEAAIRRLDQTPITPAQWRYYLDKV